MEVQLHVDVRMRQKAGTQTTKIKSAKSFVEVHPRKFIPSKYDLRKETTSLDQKNLRSIHLLIEQKITYVMLCLACTYLIV